MIAAALVAAALTYPTQAAASKRRACPDPTPTATTIAAKHGLHVTDVQTLCGDINGDRRPDAGIAVTVAETAGSFWLVAVGARNGRYRLVGGALYTTQPGPILARPPVLDRGTALVAYSTGMDMNVRAYRLSGRTLTATDQ